MTLVSQRNLFLISMFDGWILDKSVSYLSKKNNRKILLFGFLLVSFFIISFHIGIFLY